MIKIPAARIFPSILIVLFTVVIFASCHKTKPCEAIITVVDSLGNPVQGAKVVLRQDTVVSAQGVQANIYDEKITDYIGQSIHTIQWEAVLNVEASKGSLKARDYIRLEQSETVSKTVTIRK